ncbi:hypothetical protein MUK42_11397 [Musa troglodytarum]|uniref:Uncharacterized protein n=1 Tax=Musa troglodytarum TaxID=320322 RepID=A0A9E7GP50_9LILI|nr:hypothetical protein MUK42_11397 [Musa troglodytarum]
MELQLLATPRANAMRRLQGRRFCWGSDIGSQLMDFLALFAALSAFTAAVLETDHDSQGRFEGQLSLFGVCLPNLRKEMMLSKRSNVNASVMGESRNESPCDLNSMISDDRGHRVTTPIFFRSLRTFHLAPHRRLASLTTDLSRSRLSSPRSLHQSPPPDSSEISAASRCSGLDYGCSRAVVQEGDYGSGVGKKAERCED